MSVAATSFGAGAGISSEYFPNCKPAFCSTAHILSAKVTTQRPLPQHGHCCWLLAQAWMHTPDLEGGWVQGAWPHSPSLLPERPSVLLSTTLLRACTEAVLDEIVHLYLLFLTCCHYFVDYATKKIIISFLSDLISQSNVN